MAPFSLVVILTFVLTARAVVFTVDETTTKTQHCTGLDGVFHNRQSHISVRFDASPGARASIVSLAIFERTDEFVGGIELHGVMRYFCDNETSSVGLCQAEDVGSFIGRTDLAKLPLLVRAVHPQRPSDSLHMYPITQAGEYCVDMYGYDVESFRAELDFHNPRGDLDASQIPKLPFHLSALALVLLLLGVSILTGLLARGLLVLAMLRTAADLPTLAVGLHLNSAGPGYSDAFHVWLAVAVPAAVWDAAICHAVVTSISANNVAAVLIPVAQLGASLVAHRGFAFVDSKAAFGTLLRNIPAMVTFVGYHVVATCCFTKQRPLAVFTTLLSAFMLGVNMFFLLSYLASEGDGGDWFSETWAFRWFVVEEWRSCLTLIDLVESFLFAA
ncbi:hypothetical protein OQA88_5824 [Cercophora sp. LCS_1]